MRKNSYTKTIDSIKISETAIWETLETVKKVPNRKNPKNYFASIKIGGAVAVCMAVIVTLSGVFMNFDFSKKLSNNFIMTVNAQQMNNLEYIELGELKSDGSASSTEIDEDTHMFTYMNLQRKFQFPIVFKGDNIDKIHLKMNGKGYFAVLNYDNITDKEFVETKEEWTQQQNNPYPFFANPDQYTDKVYSFSISPDMQYDALLFLYVEDDFSELCKKANAFVHINEYDSYVYELHDSTWFYETFKENIDDYFVEATATYTDGSTETQKIVFDIEKYTSYYEGETDENGENIRYTTLKVKAKLA